MAKKVAKKVVKKAVKRPAEPKGADLERRIAKLERAVFPGGTPNP